MMGKNSCKGGGHTQDSEIWKLNTITRYIHPVYRTSLLTCAIPFIETATPCNVYTLGLFIWRVIKLRLTLKSHSSQNQQKTMQVSSDLLWYFENLSAILVKYRHITDRKEVFYEN